MAILSKMRNFTSQRALVFMALTISFVALMVVFNTSGATSSISARGDDARSGSVRELVPPGFQRLGQPDFGIVYNKFREIHIYGQLHEENSATVSFVTSPLVLGPLVRVELSSGGAATGDMLVEEFPLFSQLEISVAGNPQWESLISSNEQPPHRLVYEVWFHGGTEADHFENLTDIPSHADGGSGEDTLIGGSSVDHLYGGPGNDELRGGDGNDRLYGSSGSDELYGGDGDDFLKVCCESGNIAEVNLLCGGDGADNLIATSFVNNRLDGELAGGASDGDVDLLEGKSSPSTNTDYEFNVPPDILIENGVVVDWGGIWPPVSAFIPCG